MELGSSDDRVYAAERILKKRVKKVGQVRPVRNIIKKFIVVAFFRLGFFHLS